MVRIATNAGRIGRITCFAVETEVAAVVDDFCSIFKLLARQLHADAIRGSHKHDIKFAVYLI